MNSLRNQEQNTSGEHMLLGKSRSLVPVPYHKTQVKYGVIKFPLVTSHVNSELKISKVLETALHPLPWNNQMREHRCSLQCESIYRWRACRFSPLNPELNPICYLLALLRAHHFLHVSRIRVKLLTFRLLMSHIYIYIYIYIYIWSTHSWCF